MKRWRQGRGVTWKVEIKTYAGNSAVDLCSILALWVRVLWGGHLQHAHSKGIHIHWLVVLLLIHLRRHELRGTLNQNNYSELSELPYWLSGLLTTHCPLCSSNPWGVEEAEDEKIDQRVDISWGRTCEVKVGRERKKGKGGGKQKRDRKQKKEGEAGLS